MSLTLNDLDFHQETLEFSALDPVDFEKLVFHLLDEMGFGDLIWRKGGEGNSATDGGRDLEAKYWRIDPIGSTEERYWFEIKYRSHKLETRQVQQVVLNAAADGTKDRLIIVTNSTVSNQCLDWIQSFRASHKAPSIAIWQGHDLELLLRKNLRTLARFLPSALTLSGRCKVLESRYYNLSLLPSIDEVKELWLHKDKITDKAALLLPLISAEVAYGDLTVRQWGTWLSRDELFSVTSLAVANFIPLMIQASSMNREEAPIVQGISYLIQCLLLRRWSNKIIETVFSPERFLENAAPIPAGVNDFRITPILNQIYDDLAINCSAKHCLKLINTRTPKLEFGTMYFERFAEPKVSKKDKGYLVINRIDENCPIGLVEKHEYCPLGTEIKDRPVTKEMVAQRLKFARDVLKKRVTESEG